jgi:hypothetical protein
MGHHEIAKIDPQKEVFTFGGNLKKMSIVFIILGFIGMAMAYFDNHGANHHSRFWSNILLNTYYFNGMALSAVFLVAAHSIGYGGWQTILKRIFESFGYFVFVTFVFFLLIILGMWFDWHSLYHHWTHAPADDTIVGDKVAFLNKYMFTGISLAFYALWMFGVVMMRRHSLNEDNASNQIAYNQKGKYKSAAYIVIFGVSTSIFSWLAVMSLDPHWYSTLFGWYNFASYMCGFLSMAILVVTYLKYKGHLINVNENHLHNLSMLLFGFSVFYTYLWFSQYMLIWYGNIPEDTMYFYKRFQVPLFKVLFFVTLIINFAFPFLFFVKRKAKRNFWLMNIAAVILIIGHYFDFYLMVMPEPNFPIHHEASHDEAHTGDHNKTVHVAEGHAEASHTAEHASPASDTHGHKHETVQTYATLGLPEAFIFLGFVGLFLFTVLSVLSRHRIVPTKNPFLEESLRHQY